MRFALVILLVACGGSDENNHADTADIADNADTADTAGETDAAVETVAETDVAVETEDTSELEVGEVDFQVALIESASASSAQRVGFVVAGRTYDEATVGGLTVGDCTFYPALPPPFCDPPCAIGSVCIADATCGAPAVPLGAGDITVTGAAVAITLHPETQYFYYAATLTPEPTNGDLFAAGAALVATSTGGNVPAFELGVTGVTDLATPLACPPPLAAGEALVVNWTAGDGQAVHFDLESGNHGGQFARIACDARDSGSLVVDATLVDKYLAASRPVDLWRLVRGNRTLAGRVRFEAVSQVDCRW